MQPTPVAVVGASGYAGEDLLRILSGHPGAALACVTSRQNAGRRLGEVFPAFERRSAIAGLAFSDASVDVVAGSGARIAFLALPHGVAHEYARGLLDAGLRVIDLSADFRLKDPAVYQEFYGKAHPAPELLGRSVYGMPELHREAIRGAHLVATPGCYPTGLLIPLVPLVRAGLIDPATIVVNSLSGASGAGRKVELDYLFCEVNENLRAYGIPKHRHLSEIEQELAAAAGRPVTVSFVPHLVPVTRGILTSIVAASGATEEALLACLCEAYGGEPFVRLLPPGALPETKHIARSNFIDIAVRKDARTGRAHVVSAIDNLTRGTAGEAVQCFNLMAGWPETTGLLAP